MKADTLEALDVAELRLRQAIALMCKRLEMYPDEPGLDDATRLARADAARMALECIKPALEAVGLALASVAALDRCPADLLGKPTAN